MLPRPNPYDRTPDDCRMSFDEQLTNKLRRMVASLTIANRGTEQDTIVLNHLKSALACLEGDRRDG